MAPSESSLKSQFVQLLSLSLLIFNVLLVGAKSKAKADKGVDDLSDLDDENFGVKPVTKCEVCKIVLTELEHQLDTKFQKTMTMDTGYNYLQEKRKQTEYGTSMIRLQEAVESTCGAMYEYKVHRDRRDWRRFARGVVKKKEKIKKTKSKTEEAREALEKHGEEMHIKKLKSQCDQFLESNEFAIEKWYENGRAKSLEAVCRQQLDKEDHGCLAYTKTKDGRNGKGKKDSGGKSKSKPAKSEL